MKRKKKVEEDIKVPFSEGIRMLNMKGALVQPARLTKGRAIMLLEFVGQFKENFYMEHDNPSKKMEDDMQFAMQWVVNQVNKRWSQNELYSETDKR